MKPQLRIWLYHCDDTVYGKVYAHDEVIEAAKHEYMINTYDTTFFDFRWLNLFEDVHIKWKTNDGIPLATSLMECLNQHCNYVDKEIRMEHNMQRIFWGEIYKRTKG